MRRRAVSQSQISKGSIVRDATDSPNSSDPALRLDELVETLRAALTQDAGAEVRSAGALACRTILGALDPTGRTGDSSAMPRSPAVTSPTATSPIVALLGALGQMSTATSPTV